MRIIREITYSLLLAGLVSCSLFREYERQEVNGIDNLYGREASDTASMATLSWTDFFTDPHLQSLIRKGLENNPDLILASMKVQEAGAVLEASGKAFLPSVSATPNISWSLPTGNLTNTSFLGASWEADINARLTNRKRQNAVALEQAELYERSVMTELIASIATTYYSLLRLDAQLLVSKTTARSWKENVRIMKSMKEAGMTNEASVSQTEANACSIEASLFDLEYQIRQLENTLSILTGSEPGSIERGSFNASSVNGNLSFGVPAQLLSRRPDVMKAEKELQYAYYGKQIARAGFYPSLTISAGVNPIPENWLISLGAGIVQPIFARGALKSELSIAETRQEEAAVNFRKALLQAGKEVSDALALCESARGKEEARKSQIEALVSAVNSTRQLMRHSESTYLEVLTAQQSLLSAQLQQISDRYDETVGTIALYKALGGGAE